MSKIERREENRICVKERHLSIRISYWLLLLGAGTLYE